MNPNIRMRIGSYRAANATFADAVAALQGEHDHYHSRGEVYVVATYAEDTVQPASGRQKEVRHVADEPIFGMEVTIYGRDLKWGGFSDAEINWGALGSQDPEITAQFAGLLTLAVQLAQAANAEPVCPACQAELDERAAKESAR